MSLKNWDNLNHPELITRLSSIVVLKAPQGIQILKDNVVSRLWHGSPSPHLHCSHAVKVPSPWGSARPSDFHVTREHGRGDECHILRLGYKGLWLSSYWHFPLWSFLQTRSNGEDPREETGQESACDWSPLSSITRSNWMPQTTTCVISEDGPVPVQPWDGDGLCWPLSCLSVRDLGQFSECSL